ncbi:MAG TPA: hypothetical protein VEU29_03675 [Actinomycetota bacterium]|nr:hypothetical protein [Actinomycetota bacterium]
MRRIATSLLVAVVVGTLAAAPANADTWDWRDPDGRGPLSIKSIRAEHGSFGPWLRIRFDQPVKPAAWGPKDFVVADIEIDGRGKSERWVYFVSVRNQLRAFTYYPKTRSVVTDNVGFGGGPYNISLPALSYDEHLAYGGHAFAIGSFSKTGCAGGCWDVVPRRGYLIHDYTAPEITSFTTPQGYWYEPEVPVSWRVKDRGLARIRETYLRASEAGTGKWRRVTTRRKVGRHQTTLPAVEGSHVMLQVVARDRARNVTESDFRLTRIPFDQASEAGPGTFEGLWMETPDETAHGGTVHTSTLPMDSFSFSDDANAFCVIARWEGDPGTATLAAGEESTDVGPSTVLEPACVSTDRIEEQTATLTVESGRLSVDAYWSGADGVWARNGTLRPREVAGAHEGGTLPVVEGSFPSLREIKRISRSMRSRLSR